MATAAAVAVFYRHGVVVFWFVHKTFMYLDFEFTALPMSLYHVSLVLMLMFLASLFAPGLIVVNQTSTDLNGALLCLHALGVVTMEMLLYEQFSGIYPSYFVVATTAAGIFLAFRLEERKHVSDLTGQLMASIYLAKLGILSHPTPYGFRSALLLCLTTAPFSHHYWSHKQHLPMTRPKALAHVASIFLSAVITRHTLLARITMAILDHVPSEASLFAMALLVWAVACFPFAGAYFKHSMEFKRLLAAALGVAVALLFVQPNMEWLGPYLSFHGLPHEDDDSPSWPGWCLVVAVALPLIGTSHKVFRPTLVRAALAVGSGTGLGLFLCGSYIEVATLTIVVLLCVFSSLVAIFITFTVRPSMHSHEVLPYIHAIFTASLPIMWPTSVYEEVGMSTRRRAEDTETLHIALLSLLGFYHVTIALLVKSKLHASAQALSSRRALHARAAAHASVTHSWLPTVGNVSTLCAFSFYLILAVAYLEASVTSVFFLAPILLLLNHDAGFFQHLNDTNRYFPIIAATSGFLITSAAFDLTLRSTFATMHWIQPSAAASTSTATVLTQVKNLCLLGMTIPSHFLFNKFFWDFKRQSFLMWIGLFPLNLVPIVLGDHPTTSVLAILALLFGLIQFWVSHQIQQHGMQFI